MANILDLLSMRNMLALSAALNVSLMLKIIQEKERTKVRLGGSSPKKTTGALGAPASANNVSSSQETCFQNCEDNEDIEDDRDRIIHIEHGDPTMFEKYWKQMGDKTTVMIPGWKFLSYFADRRDLCWFLLPELAKEIKRLHAIVNNAVTQDRYIVVGAGSSQLYQAALYAYSSSNSSEPINVVAAAPYYSAYPPLTDCVKSGLYKWAGDACKFEGNGAYIEVVTSPNNPDGSIRHSIVNRSGGMLINDFAYYWPQYTPITSPADHDMMLFTVSKATGHAGTRIGWAIVKDKGIAEKMTKYMELTTIGVSRDAQFRSAKILKVVSDSCEQEGENFFSFVNRLLTERWKRLEEAVNQSGIFSLPKSTTRFCNFFGRSFKTLSAFAWIKCEVDTEDCESLLKEHKILTRTGTQFGCSSSYVRASMLDRDSTFDLFVKRLSQIKLSS